MTSLLSRRALGASLLLAIAWAVGPAPAAPSFRADKVYPDLGLRIRVLGNAEPEPLPSHHTYTYTFTRGDESEKRDLFDPRELWYATQHAGQWRDRDGNVLVLGRATRLLPHLADKHVTREAFDQAMADPACAFDPSRPDALAAWVCAFAGETAGAPEVLRSLGFSLQNALFYPLTNASTLACAFRVKNRQPSGQAVPSDWFCAVVRVHDGTPAAKVRKDFEMQFLANVAAVPRTGASVAAGVQAQTLDVSPSGQKPTVIANHPSRTAARKSIANMKDWWSAETAEYIFLSDIRSATGRALVKELQSGLPALRAAFAQLIPPFGRSGDVSVVRICEDPLAYKQYVGREMEWSSGAWMPMQRELVILSQGKDRDKTLEIIRHEGFHQYLFYACDMVENAAWFNEGHACFFECAQVDRQGRVELPENERIRDLLARLDEAAGQLPDLLRVGHDGFYKGSDEQRLLNYATAWGLVYYLRKGVPGEKNSPYAAILATYLKTLAEERDAAAATSAAFAGVDMPAFQRSFVDFWKKGRSAARRYDPLAAGGHP